MQQHTQISILQHILQLQQFPGWDLKHILPTIEPEISMLELSTLFPYGTTSLIDAYFLCISTLLNTQNTQETVGTTATIQNLVSHYFQTIMRHKQASHEAIQSCLMPSTAACLPKHVANISNIVWRKAGDTSTDMNYYTKRLSLGVVFSATLLYWHHANATHEETMLFFNNRLSDLFATTQTLKKINPSKENIQKNLNILKAVLWN